MADDPRDLAPQLLLVEDSPGDIRLAQHAFRGINDRVQIHVAFDGVEALAFLRREGEYVEAPRPDLILLDLNLPRMDGREVLARIKEDGDLRMIPTVVLTTSGADEDVAESYRLWASCYLNKPVQLEEFEALVKGISDFWLAGVSLPHHS